MHFLFQLAERDLAIVDDGRQARHFAALFRIAVHFLHDGLPLQRLERVGADFAKLAVANQLRQLILDFIDIRLNGRHSPFRFENQILISDFQDRRNLTVAEIEHGLLDLRIADMMVDRLNQAVGAGARIDREFSGQRGKGRRIGLGLRQQLVGLAFRGGDDQTRFDGFAIFRFERILDFLACRLDLIRGHFFQRQHRPDDVFGILLRGNMSFFLNHLQPLVGRNAKLLGQPIDFVAHFLARDDDIPLLAVLLDQIFIEHRVQHFAAVMCEAFLGKFLAADGIAIHVGNDLQLLRGRRGRLPRLKPRIES